jgi:hypothetical protein
MKCAIILAGGKKLAVIEPFRILQPYEFNGFEGEIVAARHLGQPLVDLGNVFFKTKSKAGCAVLFDNGFGYVIDNVVSMCDVDDSTIIAYPKLIADQDGSFIWGECNVEGKKTPVVSSKPNSKTKNRIDREVSERNRI